MNETVIFVLTALAGFAAAVALFGRFSPFAASVVHSKGGKCGGGNFLRALPVLCFFVVMTACGGGGGVAVATDTKVTGCNSNYSPDAIRWLSAADVKCHINAGIDVNDPLKIVGKGISTPLHIAAVHGKTETALVLIEAGADVDAKFDSGRTPLHVAAFNGQTETMLVFIKAGADMEAQDSNGLTALHAAAEKRHIETALALINVGVDVYAKNNDGDMALHLAVKRGNTNTAIALVEAEMDINAKGKNGYTALHVLADKESSDNALALALALIKRGADVKAQNDFGETPAELAISKHGKDSRIARLLLKHENK